jgi:hypothetical protein
MVDGMFQVIVGKDMKNQKQLLKRKNQKNKNQKKKNQKKAKNTFFSFYPLLHNKILFFKNMKKKAKKDLAIFLEWDIFKMSNFDMSQPLYKNG